MASSKEASTWDHELTARPVAAENRGAGRRGPDARHGKSGVVRVLALTLMFFIGALLTAVPRSSAEPPEPPFLDLGTLPADTMSGASAVNEAGQVVGWSQGSYPDPIHAFLWENGTMTDLGTLGGSTAQAYDINDKGQVVGVSSTSSGLNHAFLWQAGTMTDLGTLGGPDSYAYGLNNRGDVVGWTTGASGRPRAFLWSNGSMSDIGTLGGDAAEAWDINDAGQIVGDSEAFGLSHAFLWEDGTMTDLETLGGIRGLSGAYGINEAGQVVGYSYTQSYGMEHAFLWEDGTMTDLGAREGYTSRAFAISDVGQVVGTSNGHDLLWENGTMRDLGNTNAFDVNDEGQIVGWGLARSGQFTAVLWTTPFPPPLTSLTRLGQLGVSVTVATAINPAGQVVGFAKEDACDADPFIWENGTIARLSTPFDCARAFDINAAGQVAGSGTYRFAGDDGFLWDHGVTTELLSPDGQSTYAYGINDAGQVVGRVHNGSSAYHAALWENGTMTDLGTLGGDFGEALAINNAGQIVGRSTDASGATRAFLWEDGTMTDLGTLPGDSGSTAYNINAAGEIVGSSFNGAGASHAVFWKNGTITDLGGLGGDFSEAHGINDAGQVVGVSRTIVGGNSDDNRAVLWDDGVVTDLGILPGLLGASAYDINDAVQIVGYSGGRDLPWSAVMWTLVSAEVHDVAVTSASAAPVSGNVGTPVSISATVQNQGNQPESFWVSANATGWSASQFVENLAVGQFATLAFTWDTGSVAPGTYDVWMVAEAVPGEYDKSDNQRMAGTVTLHLPIRVTSTSRPSDTDVGLSIDFTCTAADGMPPYAFAWDFGDGTGAAVDTASHAYDTAGSKTATCAVTDDERVSATDSVTIQVFPLPSVMASVDRSTAEPGDSLTFTATTEGGSGGFTFAWEFGDRTSGDGASVTHAYTDPGQYTAIVTTRDSAGGVAANTVTVTISSPAPPPAPLVVHAFAGSNGAQVGTAVSFGCTAGDGTPPYEFAWDFGDETGAGGAAVVHAYGSSGTKTATCTVTGAGGDHATVSVVVEIYSVPTMAASVDRPNASPGTELTFTATAAGGSGTFTFDWAFGDESSAKGPKVTHAYTSPGRYTAIVTVQDAAV